ncbi:MAG: hypothetical protein ABIH67_05585 [Candidatus Uhrbacteria bacterium]
MSKTPNYDIKVKEILDSLKPGERVCDLTGEKWLMDEREIGWYKKFNVPPSKYSPLNRMRLMHGYFVMWNIWYNKHAETGKPILSTIHPATGIRVLEDLEWYDRDFSELAKDLDSSRSFLDQYYELNRSVPRPAHDNIVQPEDSIAFLSFGDQDSYFVLAGRTKRCFYCSNGFDCQDSAEIMMGKNIADSYNVLNSSRLHRCNFVRDCLDCIDCTFMFDCRNCEHCFGAANKRNKKYLWFNEQLSEREYKKRMKEVDLSSSRIKQEYENRFEQFLKEQAVWPENVNINCENSTGEYLEDTTNARECYHIRGGSRDLDHVTFCLGAPSHDCAYCGGATGASDCYYSTGVTNCKDAKFCMNFVTNSQNVEYCERCNDCENCFGCVGLVRKKFCILNKQYSEEDYWKVLDDLKCQMLDQGEYGDIPNLRFSTQHWTCLLDLYEIDRDMAIKLGAEDFDLVSHGAEGPEIDPARLQSPDSLPDCVTQIDFESVTNTMYQDDVVNRRYGYLRPELELYQRLNIAPPRKHPRSRMLDLELILNKPEFIESNCQMCNKPVTIAKNLTYPDRKIYCRPCYLEYLEQYG